MNRILTTAGIVAVALAATTQARAQNEVQPPPGEKAYGERLLEAPTKALEVVVGTGYTQGFGQLQQGVNMQDVATPGLGVDLQLGYRFDPRWAFLVAGQYQEFQAERADAARGLTGGLAIAYHFSPYTRVDPWLQFGTGYRLLWETHPDPTPNLMTHGFEPAKLSLGLDVRVSRDVAIAPVIGADLTVPLWQSVGNAPSTAIPDPRAAIYVFAGLQARFDATGTHARPVTQQVEQTTVTEAQVNAPPPEPIKPISPSISVSEEVLKECNIALDNPPNFDFDKSDLLPQDMPTLQKIAECFSTGPLKNDGVSLIGRADPRGSVEYNQALGMRRANSVANFLEQHGVKAERIQRISRGKLDATGTDEAGWATDRRVDVSKVVITISRR